MKILLNRPVIVMILILGGFFMPKNVVSAVNIETSLNVTAQFQDENIKPRPFRKRLQALYIKLASSDKTKHKLALAALTVTLGVFGAHRMYLGTEPHVPVLYALTLGGGLGIVPVIDLIHILVSKDPLIYSNDKRFFMWGQADK